MNLTKASAMPFDFGLRICGVRGRSEVNCHPKLSQAPASYLAGIFEWRSSRSIEAQRRNASPVFSCCCWGGAWIPGAVHALTVPPLRRLRLVNAHTKETFDGPYHDDIGPFGLAIDELSLLLRDHHSGEQIAIDVGVIDFLPS